ncbi:MAG: hypothetical protein JO021_08130 [Alphaproteobacteria bacterium]|nr:hypothetical protein [Alphaproteobacteria bacterium]
MLLDPNELRATAQRYRRRATELAAIGRAAPDPKMRDGYTALVAEYDVMAGQLERLAAQTSAVQMSGAC